MKGSLARVGLILLMAMLMVGMAGTAVLAQGGTKQVGLVVRYDDGSEDLMVVTVPVDATALRVLRASGLDIETDDSSGWGTALCRIGPDGCPASDCFCSAEYWAFWVLNTATGDWESSMVGIDSHIPAHGSVLGFSWTASDEDWNPLIKPTAFSFNYILEIPEPASLLLLGGGLAGLAGYLGLRRRSR